MLLLVLLVFLLWLFAVIIRGIGGMKVMAVSNINLDFFILIFYII